MAVISSFNLGKTGNIMISINVGKNRKKLIDYIDRLDRYL